MASIALGQIRRTEVGPTSDLYKRHSAYVSLKSAALCSFGLASANLLRCSNPRTSRFSANPCSTPRGDLPPSCHLAVLTLHQCMPNLLVGCGAGGAGLSKRRLQCLSDSLHDRCRLEGREGLLGRLPLPIRLIARDTGAGLSKRRLQCLRDPVHDRRRLEGLEGLLGRFPIFVRPARQVLPQSCMPWAATACAITSPSKRRHLTGNANLGHAPSGW